MSKLKVETIAVIVRLNNNKIHQVALKDEQITALKAILPSLFNDCVLAIMPTELEGITIDINENFNEYKNGRN
jgi:hypothetical protein